MLKYTFPVHFKIIKIHLNLFKTNMSSPVNHHKTQKKAVILNLIILKYEVKIMTNHKPF